MVKETMKDYTLQERANFYNQAFPDYPELIVGKDGRITGMWIMGNNYHTAGDYGAYPHGYMKRISSLFPDCKNILHLFSVNIPSSADYIRFDLHPEFADVTGDAHKLSEYFGGDNKFDIIYADPPYSVEDCEHYGTPMVNRNKVVKECYKILKPDGFLVWLDQVLPMYRKDEFRIVGVIGMVKSTNHRFRVITIFQKLKKQ
jgi:hypothetical protein